MIKAFLRHGLTMFPICAKVTTLFGLQAVASKERSYRAPVEQLADILTLFKGLLWGSSVVFVGRVSVVVIYFR